MRVFYFLGVAVLPLAGCMTAQQATLKTAQEAQALVTPEVTKQCTDAILAVNPTAKIEGSFFLGSRTHLDYFGPGDKEVLLAAPTSTVGAFNATYKQYLACSYELRDNRLEFRQVNVFRKRI